MNSYIKIINKNIKEQPDKGSYIVICEAVKSSKLNRNDLSKIFNSVMPKNEFVRSERIELIDYLVCIAKK